MAGYDAIMPATRRSDEAPSGQGEHGPARLGLIWAQARGGVIGAGGTMPWHLPEDLQHFKRTTKGSPVVMGRHTWESFPPRFRPLPGRTNIVITRNDTFAAAGALRAKNLPEALRWARETLAPRGPAGDSAGSTTLPQGPTGDGAGSAPLPSTPGNAVPPTIWVIGGGAVYREAIDAADLLVVTEIDLDVDGDTTAPAIPERFCPVSTDPEDGWHESASGLRYRIRVYAQ